MSWENLVYTLIGGLIAIFSVLVSEWWKERISRRKIHFEDLKHKCLEPILNRLLELKQYFIFKEGGVDWSRDVIYKELRSDIRWWEYLTFKNSSGADPLLYEDLKNHYPDLYKCLEDVEKLFKNKYVEFLQEVYNLLEAIENDKELFEIRKEFSDIKDPTALYKVIMFLALGVDKGYWPNIYSSIKSELDKLVYLGEKYRARAENIKSLSNNIVAEIDKCINMTKKVILESKLRGKCDYI
jgi:hypothetical protein